MLNSIKEQANLGYRPGEIARILKLDIKTVEKYLAKEDFSPIPPLVTEAPSKRDSYKGIIDTWLEELVLDAPYLRQRSHFRQGVPMLSQFLSPFLQGPFRDFQYVS